MPVVSLNIGNRRVHLTAYCPIDALGLLACDYALLIAKQVLDNTTPEQLRAWLEQHVSDATALYAALDAGFVLPKGPENAIDPTNPLAELRIVKHLQREAMEQTNGQRV